MRVNITVPVYNEEAALPVSIPRLSQFLDGVSGFDCEMVIADNASTDRSYEVACGLARQLPRVRVARLELKGRGRALKQVWSESTADFRNCDLPVTWIDDPDSRVKIIKTAW